MPNLYISKITINGVTYLLKDSEAQHGGISFVLATDADTTPKGVTWDKQGITITGALEAADAVAGAIYLVPAPQSEVGTKNVYYEYVAVQSGADYIWEQLGDTRVSLTGLVTDVQKGNGDMVLGASTTISSAASSVSFTGGTNDTFVKSYPGTSSKLETAQITGVGSNVTFNAVASATDATATNTVFGSDASASLIVTEEKTATNTVFGTATTASKATAGTAVALAKAAGSATNVSYIGNASTSTILGTASYDSDNENLTFTSVSVSQGTVTGTNGTESITPYTFADVTVPVVSSNTSVTSNSVKTNTTVTVPQVTSNEEVTASKVTTASKTAATAGTAQTVATGSLKANDSVGAEIMTGLGTAVTASAVTGIGTGTAAAQNITVGTNDQVKVAVYDDIVVTKHN